MLPNSSIACTYMAFVAIVSCRILICQIIYRPINMIKGKCLKVTVKKGLIHVR